MARGRSGVGSAEGPEVAPGVREADGPEMAPAPGDVVAGALWRADALGSVRRATACELASGDEHAASATAVIAANAGMTIRQVRTEEIEPPPGAAFKRRRTPRTAPLPVLHDERELLGVEARAPHQRPVHLRVGHEPAHVPGFHAAAVLDADGLRHRLVVQAGE